MKICKICNQKKQINEFYKNRCKCKLCFIKIVKTQDTDEKKEKRNKWRIENNYNKIYYTLNKEKEKNRKKEYRIKYPEKTKEYIIKNKEILSEKSKIYYQNNKEKKLVYSKKYLQNNKERKNKNQKNLRNTYIKNPIYKLRYSMKERIRGYLKSHNLIKNNKTFKIIGINPSELKIYLENKFQEGMSWDNYGLHGWHIDHIIPISSGRNKEELYKLFHYTNLQPLWAIDNLRKSNKIPASMVIDAIKKAGI